MMRSCMEWGHDAILLITVEMQWRNEMIMGPELWYESFSFLKI